MKMLTWAGWWLLSFLPSAALAATISTPQCMNSGGSLVPCIGVTPVDASGNPLSWSSLFGSVGAGGGASYSGPLASQLPASLGARAGSASLPIVPATDASFPVTGTFWQSVQPISVSTLPLPAGASTAANQATEIGSLSTIAANSAAQATATKQDMGNNSLATIATNTAGLPTGTPVRSFDETNAIAGRGFSWGTGVISVASGSRLNVVFANPAGSGKTAYIVLREYGQSGTTPLTAILYTNPSIPTGSTTTGGGNRLMGASTASVSTISYLVSTTALSTGTPGAAVFIAPNGENTDTTIMRIVPPGYSFGYTIMAPGGGLAAATSMSVSIAGWEQ